MVEEEVTPPEAPETASPKFKSRRFLFAVLSVLAGLLFLVGAYFLFVRQGNKPSSATNNSVSETEESTSDPNTVRLVATGDFIAHEAINLRAEGANDTYDYSPMLAEMRPFFQEADVRFCNQATLAGGEKFGITGYPVFNAPFDWIHDLSALGCNVINVGTNHTNDKGQGAITAQLEEWDKQAAVYAVAGANRSSTEQKEVRYFEAKGVKFAFVSYSTYSNAPNPNPYSLNRFTEPLVTDQMTEAREQADIVIVSMRWGTEYSPSINDQQDKDAQKLADLGADIVLGHGPHVLQPVKQLKGEEGNETLVWFSLGNFLNAQLETEALVSCLVDISIDVPTKKVRGFSCLPIYQHYEWTAEEKAREDLLKRQNFKIVPLDTAEGLISQSQLDTTVEAQLERIRGIVNTYTKVSVRESVGL